jgi:hypothetical protein
LYCIYHGTETYRSEKRNAKFWSSNYSSAYLEAIKNQLKSIKNPIGASINTINADPFYHKKYYIYNPLGYYMKTMDEGYHTVGLSYYEICTQCQGFQFLCQRDRFAFYNYATSKLKENEYTPLNHIKSQFINEYKMDYLIVEENGIIPSPLASQLTLVAKDSYSGESFYLIRRNN